MVTIKETNNSKLVICSSIQDFVNYINSNPLNGLSVGNEHSQEEGSYRKSFTGTDNYAQAEDLLLHGWEYMAKELKSKIGANTELTGHTQRQVYSVAGVVPCVPRYLQGLPDSMVMYKRVPKKEKVLTINKDFCYSFSVRQETIINESVKVLNVVNMLEKQGYRVKLNIVCTTWGSMRGNKKHTVKVCIKQSSQRLNIKQIAFSLVHPSMLRRIWFKCIEHDPFCNLESFAKTKGYCMNSKEQCKGEYYIPNRVSENEITDISKYWVE